MTFERKVWMIMALGMLLIISLYAGFLFGDTGWARLIRHTIFRSPVAQATNADKPQ